MEESTRIQQRFYKLYSAHLNFRQCCTFVRLQLCTACTLVRLAHVRLSKKPIAVSRLVVFLCSVSLFFSSIISVYASGTFIYNPRTLQWHAINDSGKVVRSGHGSGGQSYCSDIKRSCRTPSGTYRVISKGGAGCKSSRYPVGRGGAPMPYCMFFSKYYAVHGSYDVPRRNASHGCIRVHPGDARWLSNNFMSVGTKVVVKPY